MLGVHYVSLCIQVVNDSGDKSMKKCFIMFSYDNGMVLSPFVHFCLKKTVIQNIEMSHNTDLWTKYLKKKTVRLKVELTNFNCHNEGLHY